MSDYSVLYDLENLAEPSFKEYRTTEYIINFLKNINIIPDKTFKTGCFGTLDFNKSKTVAIRADIDALPVDKEKGIYKHLCGHHLHTAALLLTLKKIVEGHIKPNVNIRFIFQPAEEIISGARFIIEEGAVSDVDEIYGLHVDPDIDLGIIGIKPGELMAGSNHFHIKMVGKSTHGAYPHLGTDLIVAAADFINLAQKIVSRKINPLDESLITFGKINGGTAGNILPGSLDIEGTFRYFNKGLKDFISDELISCAKSIENFYGIKVKVDILDGTPPVVNDPALCEKAKDICEKSGIKFITDLPKTMGGEDFALYQERVPGVFFRVGIKTSDKIIPLHNINFRVPDETLDFAVNFWTNLIKSL